MIPTHTHKSRNGRPSSVSLVATVLAMVQTGARTLDRATESANWSVRWVSTVKLSASHRLKDADAPMTNSLRLVVHAAGRRLKGLAGWAAWLPGVLAAAPAALPPIPLVTQPAQAAYAAQVAQVAPDPHAAKAAQVAAALDRPAVAVQAPQRTVLLAAERAGTRTLAVGERGIIAVSDDEGRTWRQASVPTSVTLTAVRFTDAQRGWVVGHGGTVLVTEDGGQRWTRQLDGRRAAQLVLEAARAAGEVKAIADAERLAAEGADKPLLDLLLLGGQRLLVVGAYGLALVSDDGGRSWQSWMPRLPNPKGLHLYAARQQGQTLLLAGEQGLVLLSSDGGHSFRRVETPYKGSFFSAELLGERDIVLAGLRGTMLRSTDGGATWSTIAVPMPASITATVLTAGGHLLAVNQAGFVMSLQGDRLVPTHAAPLPPLNGLLARAGAPLLALTVQGAMTVGAEPGPKK